MDTSVYKDLDPIDLKVQKKMKDLPHSCIIVNQISVKNSEYENPSYLLWYETD